MKKVRFIPVMPVDWILRMAELEGDQEIGAGLIAIDPCECDAKPEPGHE